MSDGAAPGQAAPAPKVVLVTGVSRYLGAQVAARLAADPRIERVIALDERRPPDDLSRVLADTVEFAQADIKTSEPAKIIVQNRVEAVVHLAIASAADPRGRAATKEQNVIGTIQLLAACQQAPDLRKIVFRSSTAAYGASFRDPAVFTESTEPREVPRGGFARDVLDAEGYLRGFRRRRPHVATTVLRFAPFVGRRANTSLTRYFAQPVIPTVIGRDPRLQFIHVDDALEVLHRSVVEDHPGTYNVAGAGVLTLSQAVRRARRIPMPVLEFGMSAMAGFAKSFGVFANSFGVLDFSLDQLDLFVHGRVVDTTRLVAEYGFEPRSTAAAFADFLRGIGGGGMVPHEPIRLAERGILDGIRRVRSALGTGGGA